LGSSVLDAFGITAADADSDGAGRTALRDELERDLYAILPTPPPAKPAAQAG
jgi:[protein-PII] uridylyltransferase